jgi:hypothetical protein
MQPSTILENKSWKDFYTAALLENDPARISPLIARAESEIVTRARALFGTPGDHSDETDALDDALYMLRALKGCLAYSAISRDVAA